MIIQMTAIACEQALIFVVIKDVARAAKPRVTSRRAQRAGERSGTRNESLQGRHCFPIPAPRKVSRF